SGAAAPVGAQTLEERITGVDSPVGADRPDLAGGVGRQEQATCCTGREVRRAGGRKRRAVRTASKEQRGRGQEDLGGPLPPEARPGLPVGLKGRRHWCPLRGTAVPPRRLRALGDGTLVGPARAVERRFQSCERSAPTAIVETCRPS